MLRRVQRELGKPPRYAFIIRGADTYDIRNICRTNESYLWLALTALLWTMIGAGGAAFAASIGQQAFREGRLADAWVSQSLGYVMSFAGIWFLVWTIHKVIDERKCRKQGIRDSARFVYDDSAPFKALVETLGPKAWDVALDNMVRGTTLGGALTFQLHILFDDTYVSFVTPDGILSDDS